MSKLLLLIQLILCAETIIIHGKNKDCVVNNFKFQQDFDMKRYPDVMYHQLYLQGVAPRDGVSFVRHLRNDTVASRVSARNPKTGLCEDYMYIMRNDMLGSPKLRITAITQPEPSTMTFYVGATDYKNYLMLYNCPFIETDGTCKRGNLFVGSLQSATIRQEDLRLAKELAENFCLDPSKFKYLREQEVCPEGQRLRAQFEAERTETDKEFAD